MGERESGEKRKERGREREREREKEKRERETRKRKERSEIDRQRERKKDKESIAHGLEIRNFFIRDTNFFHKSNFQFRAKISLTRNFAPPM